MNSYERLFSRIDRTSVDKIPNLSIYMGFAAKHSNILYKDFCLVPDKMVQANLLCVEKFGADIVTVMSDPYGEAIDYGLQVNFPENSNPIGKGYLWCNKTPSADAIITPKIDDTFRMKARIETIKLYSEKVKDICPIAGWIEGTVAEYCNLRGINDAMLDMADEENYLDDIFDKLTQQAIYYAKEQIKAGADIIGIGDAVCSMMGNNLYKKYAYPHQKRIIDAIHEAGALVKLHICGNTTAYLDDIATLKPDIFDVDHMVDFAVAARKLDDFGLVSGNVDPVSVLLQGTPEYVKQEVHKCINQAKNNCCISGGCETPLQTPIENVLALNESLYYAKTP